MIALALLSLLTTADVRRVAVVVGANLAPEGRQRLRYAHADADHMADALARVGRFASADVLLLKDPRPDELLAALDKAVTRATPSGNETMFLFYYSGHADVTALYPHGQALPLAQVKQRLERSKATVRIGVLDACRGGGWTTAKSLAPDAPFDIPIALGLRSQGSVFVASSSGIEDAHESEALQGSFFTHHFVAGLLGAADTSGDGAVTLNEAYRYAQSRTVRDSAIAAQQPQHPSFEMHLAGRDDLTLSETREEQGWLALQQETGPLEVIHLGTGVVVLEMPDTVHALKSALPPGRYLVRLRSSAGTRTREVTLEAGVSVLVREADLTLVGAAVLAQKNAEEVAQEVVQEAPPPEPGPPERAPDRIGKFVSMVGTGGSADVLGASAAGLQIAGGAKAAFIGSFALLLRPTERLTLALGTLAASYRFGDDFETVLSGGFVRWGTGYSRPGAADAYAQLFGVLGLGVDVRGWLVPERVALIAGVRAENAFTMGPITKVTNPQQARRITGTDTWQTGAYAGVQLRATDWLTFNIPVVARMTPLYDGRGSRWAAEWDWSAGIGSSAFGLESVPMVRARVQDHVALDLYAEAMARSRAFFGQLSVGVTLFF